MFRPPHCPNPACARHLDPREGFYLLSGSYRPRCRARAVQRYRCRTCQRSFSEQTFRMDFRDHRPDRNAALVRSIAAGAGLRQSARRLGLSLRCTELKLRKITRHLEHLGHNLGPKAALRKRAVGQDGTGGRVPGLETARAAVARTTRARATTRTLRPAELLGWRQDWGPRSPHPLSRAGVSHARWVPRVRGGRSSRPAPGSGPMPPAGEGEAA